MKNQTSIADILKLKNLRAAIERDYAPSRERSLALTKLDEAELWLTRCAPAESSDDEAGC